MRMLMMFGPMLYGMYQKYQRNQSKQQPTQKAANQIDRERQANQPPNKDSSEHA